MGLLNALGKSKIVLLFSVIAMAGIWIIGTPLILLYGAIGFAIANLRRAIQCLLDVSGRAAAHSIPITSSHRASLGDRGCQRYFRLCTLPRARPASHLDHWNLWDLWFTFIWAWYVSILSGQVSRHMGSAQGNRMKTRRLQAMRSFICFVHLCDGLGTGSGAMLKLTQ